VAAEGRAVKCHFGGGSGHSAYQRLHEPNRIVPNRPNDLCRELDDGSFTRDNCVLVDNTQHVRSFGPGVYEFGAGDIFNLSERKMAPFVLPTEAINMMELRKIVKKRNSE
jgi:hypothetical protein